MTKKLIETDIPLQAINQASAKEKSIRHKHPSTLHLWWSRKPLATTRAVLWASLVDDPSEHPEKFPDKHSQDAERKRLADILAALVEWDRHNVVNPKALAKALAELPDTLPELLDPFAGGGSIPLEAQRLGLSVHAHDLNPIAVMLNKAMIELPAKFANSSPVHPNPQKSFDAEQGGAKALADDVKFYGQQLKELARAKIGHMYPAIQTPDGEATVIAWLWARTVKCPNPACGCDMPLVSSFTLSTKQNVHVEPKVSGGRITYRVVEGGSPAQEAKTGRGKFRCVACGAGVGTDWLHEQFSAHNDGRVMLAVVAEGKNGRVYLSPSEEHVRAADVPMPEEFPDGEMPDNPRWFSPPVYGMKTYASLFTARQLTMLATLAELLPEIRERVRADAEEAGRADAEGYAAAVSVYLAFVIDKLTQYNSSICSWNVSGEKMRDTFTRQAIPMMWDYAEANPFCNSSGCFDNMLGWVVDVLESLPANVQGTAEQHDAQAPCSLRNVMVSTDPPYYDNIGYSDLSDYFYIWMRQTLRDIYPELFRRVLTPKAAELIATPYRHDDSPAKAKAFFEAGMQTALRNMYDCASDDYPATIYYAYKQKETDSDGEASTGWETMLNAVISAGFQVTATWPLRTEMTNRMLAQGTNALASSVVLVCRRRSKDAPGTTKRVFDVELSGELRGAVAELLKGNVAPVDIPQAAIGKGIAVYSKYSRVVDSEGKELTVRDVLKQINRELDPDQMEMDASSRFCAELYALVGYKAVVYDDAEKIALRNGVVVASLESAGLVFSGKGKVSLRKREELRRKEQLSTWEAAQLLTLAKDVGGNDECASIYAAVGEAEAEKARELVYRLYATAERSRWLDETKKYNALILSWPDIKKLITGINSEAAKKAALSRQGSFDDKLKEE